MRKKKATPSGPTWLTQANSNSVPTGIKRATESGSGKRSREEKPGTCTQEVTLSPEVSLENLHTEKSRLPQITQVLARPMQSGHSKTSFLKGRLIHSYYLPLTRPDIGKPGKVQNHQNRPQKSKHPLAKTFIFTTILFLFFLSSSLRFYF